MEMVVGIWFVKKTMPKPLQRHVLVVQAVQRRNVLQLNFVMMVVVKVMQKQVSIFKF